MIMSSSCGRQTKAKLLQQATDDVEGDLLEVEWTTAKDEQAGHPKRTVVVGAGLIRSV